MHNHNHTAQSRWRQARWPYPSQPMDLREPASRNSSFSSSLLEVPIPTPLDSIPPSPSLTAPLRAEILEAAYASSDDDDDESPQQLHPLTHTYTHTRTDGIPLPPTARTHLPGNRVGSLARDSIPINLARETSRHSHHVPAHTRSPPSAHPHAHLLPHILADIPHLDLARLAHRLHDRLPTLALPHLPVVHAHAPPLIQRRMSVGGHHEIDGAWGARVRGWMSMKRDSAAAPPPPPPPQATPTIDPPPPPSPSPPPPLVHIHLWSTDSPPVEGEHIPPSESNAAAALLLLAPSTPLSSALISPPRSPPMTASTSPDLSPPQSISLELDPPTPMHTPALYSDRLTPPQSILLDPSELEYEYQHETMITTTTTTTTAKGKSASNTSSTPTPSTTTTTTTTMNLQSSSSSLPPNAAIRLLSLHSLSLTETPPPLPKAAQEYGILPPTWTTFVVDLRTACEDKEREEAAEAAAEDKEEEEEGHLSYLPERIKLGLPRRIVDSHPSLRGHGHPPSSRPSRPSPSTPNPHPYPTYKTPNLNPNRLSTLLERYNTHVFTPLGIQALLCHEFPRAESAKPRWAIYVLELASDAHTPRARAGAALATTSSSSLSTSTGGSSLNADRSISLAQRFGRVPEGLWKIDICDPVVWHLRVSLFPAAGAGAALVREEGDGDGDGDGERRILEEATRDVFGVAGSVGSSTLSFGESFF